MYNLLFRLSNINSDKCVLGASPYGNGVVGALPTYVIEALPAFVIGALPTTCFFSFLLVQKTDKICPKTLFILCTFYKNQL